MPGNGTIGGGKSFHLQVQNIDENGNESGEQHHKDASVAEKFTICFVFPDQTTKFVTVNADDQVYFEWPYQEDQDLKTRAAAAVKAAIRRVG